MMHAYMIFFFIIIIASVFFFFRASNVRVPIGYSIIDIIPIYLTYTARAHVYTYVSPFNTEYKYNNMMDCGQCFYKYFKFNELLIFKYEIAYVIYDIYDASVDIVIIIIIYFTTIIDIYY